MAMGEMVAGLLFGLLAGAAWFGFCLAVLS
jgi:hypothetical protein